MKTRARRQHSSHVEVLEDRWLLSATVFQHEEIGYFLDEDAPALQRYDIENEQWLSPINLPSTHGDATVAMADADGLYIAFDRALYRYNLNGTGETHVMYGNRTLKLVIGPSFA